MDPISPTPVTSPWPMAARSSPAPRKTRTTTSSSNSRCWRVLSSGGLDERVPVQATWRFLPLIPSPVTILAARQSSLFTGTCYNFGSVDSQEVFDFEEAYLLDFDGHDGLGQLELGPGARLRSAGRRRASRRRSGLHGRMRGW